MTTLPGSLPAASPAAVPASPALTPMQAALAAAEARARLPPSEPAPSTSADAHTSAPFVPSAADKLPFFRLLEAELLPKTGKVQAVKTLELLIQIVGNILEPPVPAQAAKYRTLRLSNTGIVRNIVDITGAYEYLVNCGFRKSTVEFIPYLTFSSAPTAKQLHGLKVGQFVLLHVVEKARAAEEREKRFRESEKDAEKARVGRVMLGYEEDRRLKREKDDRDKIVRDSRAAQAREAEAQAIIANEDQLGDHPVLGGRNDASTMDVDSELNDPPPSYGALHGRVLGTGEAVTIPVRDVSAQDEEFSDDGQEEDSDDE